MNDQNIIKAFNEVYIEFCNMSDEEFNEMLNKTELDSLGYLLYECYS